MKIALINDVHIGKDLVKDGVVRAASSKVLSKFPDVLELIQQQHPDVLIDLGDLIRSSSVEEDVENYTQAIQLFKSLTLPTIHMLGNHEVKLLKPENITAIWKEHGITQDTYGSLRVGELRFIWLDFELRKDEKGILAYLSEQRLRWLDEELAKDNTPTVLLTHYVCTDQNYEGNFFFEKGLEIFASYTDRNDLQAVLKKHQHIVVVFSAHVHMSNYKVVDSIPHVTLPAMVDNIAAPESNDNFPGIYTIVDITEQEIIVKQYSGKFCFSTIELERK